VLRRSLVVLVATLAAAGAAFAGNGDKQQIRFNAADQAAARAATMRSSDLDAGWTGGTRKPDLSPGPSCANFNPKRSDLVLTGAAATDYSAPSDIRSVSTEVQVLKTARMVALDWRRTVLAPGLLSCLRSFITKGMPPGTTVVSVAKLSFPHVAQYSAAFRVVLDVTASGQTVRIVIDEILIGARRTEITLSSLDFAAHASGALAAETVWARKLAARIRA
jgi:hypothetical protein